MEQRSTKSVWKLSLFVVVAVIIGTIGLTRFGHIPWLDALYAAVTILLSHYDYHDFTSPSARAVILLLDATSLAALAYLITWFAEYIIGFSTNVRKKRIKVKVDRLKDHYIVCGLGRVGSQVAREMHNEGVAFVALDRDQEKVNEAIANGYLALCLDSTDEKSLMEVGLAKATGLVATLGEDSLNLFVTLAARSLNPNLYIVARANRQENEVKLKRAGADRVALPYQIGGYHMASMALRPNVVDYIDVVSGKGASNDLEVEEMVVGEQSRLAGHRLGKAFAEGQIGATVIAINGADGTSRVRPSGQEVIYAGDRLIILGAKRELTNASALIR